MRGVLTRKPTATKSGQGSTVAEATKLESLLASFTLDAAFRGEAVGGCAFAPGLGREHCCKSRTLGHRFLLEPLLVQNKP